MLLSFLANQRKLKIFLGMISLALLVSHQGHRLITQVGSSTGAKNHGRISVTFVYGLQFRAVVERMHPCKFLIKLCHSGLGSHVPSLLATIVLVVSQAIIYSHKSGV